jgi:hypothetical protein
MSGDGEWIVQFSMSGIEGEPRSFQGADPLFAFQSAIQYCNQQLFELNEAGSTIRQTNGELFFKPGAAPHVRLMHLQPNPVVHVPLDLLGRLNPSRDLLFDLMREKTDDRTLHEIALADYGNDEKEHFGAIQRIRDTGRIPRPIPWQGGEVLTLTQYSEPETDEWEGSRSGMPGHLGRAFVCAVLLRADAEFAEDGRSEASETTIIQLVGSALVLDNDIADAALGFLAWRSIRSIDADRPFFALAVLLLAFLRRRTIFSDDEYGRLAEWVMAEERRGSLMDPAELDSPWSTLFRFNSIREPWLNHVYSLKVQAAALTSISARERLDNAGRESAGAAQF